MSQLSYIDIHAHLNSVDFDLDREVVIKQMKAEKVGAINIGTDLLTSHQALTLADQNEHLWAVVGIHPHEAEQKHDFADLTDLAQKAKVVAIGECGLDYFRLLDKSIKQKQKDLFVKQIELASVVNKPLMLHVRDAYEDILDILKAYPKVRTHAHFFAGDWSVAKRFIDRGDTISFTGVITFTSQYNEVIEKTPLDHLLAETDCPFVTPVPFRGQRNDPIKVSLIVEKIAMIRKDNQEIIQQALLKNAIRIFNL